MKKRILFVDDEPKILEALGRSLRPMRSEWEVHFATGGPEGLSLMDQLDFDLVVSDMRMPGMTGLKFLAEVRDKHPQIIRLILSGQADRDLIMRSVGIAHQYISKPCEADALISILNGTMRLRSVLADEKLKLLVSRLGNLPSLPSLYLEIVDELQSEDPSIRKVGEIIAKDVAMTAKILQLVNSAFFGIRRRIANPIDAASYLGLEIIQSLVLSVQAFSQFDAARTAGLSVDRVWSHSLKAAAIARRIAGLEQAPKGTLDEAFTAGMLHDIGRVVLGASLPGVYQHAVARSGEEEELLCESELQELGATHAEVGAYLLGLWGLPDSIVEAIALHHRPHESAQPTFSLLTAIHAAEAIEPEVGDGEGMASPRALDLAYLEKIGLAGQVNRWREECRNSLGQGSSQ